MTLKYLCIDDQPGEVEAKLHLLSGDKTKIIFECVAPLPMEKLIDLIKQKSDSIQGILMDLRLDRVAGSEGRVSFNAPTLGAQLRSLMSERKFTPMPIVLWTVPNYRRALYDKDRGSHDAFDELLDKEQLEGDAVDQARSLLVALASGYQELLKHLPRTKKLATLLKAPARTMDPRAESGFLNLGAAASTVSDVAHFIKKDLLDIEGPLISRKTLCARLGIRQDRYSGTELEAQLQAFVYSGPFAAGYERWWWKAVESWWAGKFKQQPMVLSLTAEQRLLILEQKGLATTDAVIAAPGQGDSARYTSTCSVTGRALDPVNGVMMDDSQLKPWQDKSWVHYDVASKPAQYDFDLTKLDSSARASLKRVH